MDITNLNEAERLKLLRQKLALADSKLNSLPLIRIKMYDVFGNEVDLSMIDLSKNEAVASPNPYQTLGDALVTDLRTALQAQIDDVNDEITALSC